MKETYPLEGRMLEAADSHRPEPMGCGCTCGFGAWSAAHVAVMAYREAAGGLFVIDPEDRDAVRELVEEYDGIAFGLKRPGNYVDHMQAAIRELLGQP